MKSKIACVVAFGVAAACGGEGRLRRRRPISTPRIWWRDTMERRRRGPRQQPDLRRLDVLTNWPAALSVRTGADPVGLRAVARDGINQLGRHDVPRQKYGKLVGRTSAKRSPRQRRQSQSGTRSAPQRDARTSWTGPSAPSPTTADEALSHLVRICHGWARTLSPSPRQDPVTRDGITFTQPISTRKCHGLHRHPVDVHLVPVQRGGAGDPSPTTAWATRSTASAPT